MMTPSQATSLSKHGRRLLRRGLLTHRDYALLDCLLWSCRVPGRAEARVSYTRLQSLAHMARETIAKGLRRLEALGLLVRQKTRLRVAWAFGVASRQGVTIYTLQPAACTEFDRATVICVHSKKARKDADREAAVAALADIAARRIARLGLSR